MITGELKNRIDSLWDDFAAGGIVNPLTVIEQITYLVFIHDLDEADNKGSMEAMMLGIFPATGLTVSRSTLSAPTPTAHAYRS